MRRRKLLCLLLFLFLVAATALAQSPQQYDVLIRNGRVVDGSGNPWTYADIGIQGDKIAFVGRAPQGATAKRVLDASGLIVAPGFIDMLGQSEQNLLIDKSATSKLTQGITTEITGEGESIAPINDAMIAESKDVLEHYHLTVDWRTLEQYFQRLEREKPGVNLATYVGAAQVRAYVMGRANRAPTATELKRMQDLVDESMRQGAMGVSSALIYAPGAYAKTDELIALAQVAAENRYTRPRFSSGDEMHLLRNEVLLEGSGEIRLGRGRTDNSKEPVLFKRDRRSQFRP